MKAMAHLLLLLPLVALTHGYCTQQKLFADIVMRDGVPVLEEGPCKDESGGSRLAGEQWRESGCMLCTCGETYISCCSIGGRAVNFAADCEAVMDVDTCRYSVVKKDDPSQTCAHDMKLLLIALLFCGLVPMYHAAVLQPAVQIISRGCSSPTGLVPIGASWRNAKCETCICGANYIPTCTLKLSIPVMYDSDCELFLDTKLCVYKVVKIADHSISCPYRGMTYPTSK
uniref:Uncharacterized protein LOC116940344 isoform X1 n=2 Tax=Petromyzon marinus TaxID=7757 RepID=A0AAJ7WQE5_PETMA|nr:uncharacterized protein LOC116940344 isoform X1 [Petromyzon marinus]XP_032805973.1 uncharacterized protein LOC116940344 isoform X1 [Petromyzon marinus]